MGGWGRTGNIAQLSWGLSLEKRNHEPKKMTRADNLKKKIINVFKPNEKVVDILKILKVVSVVTLINLLLHLYDYIQDFKVVTTFWSIGYMEYSMNNSMGYAYLKALLLEFYPPAMFLSIVDRKSVV